MTRRRWRESLGPPLLAVLIAATTVVPAAAGPSRIRPATAFASKDASAPPAACKALPRGQSRGMAWYRLDPLTDENGWLTGFRFVAGRVAERTRVEVTLPPESFASGPRDGRVLVGADDGQRSSLHLVDVARRCTFVVHEGPELVRRATLTPQSDAIVEFRLDRRTRDDLGIWLRPLDGTAPHRIMEPLAPNSRIGLIFSTEFRWSEDGRRLAVTSCGKAACLVRVLDRATGRVRTVDEDGVGEAIALVGNELVAYGGCPSLPCRIVARNLETGRIRELARRAGLAILTTAGDGGAALAFENYARPGTLGIRRISGAGFGTVRMADGVRLVPAEHRALAGLETGPGTVAVAAGGRPRSARVPASFVDLAARRIVPAGEVLR